MLPMILMSLLGVGLLATIYEFATDDGDDDDNSEPVPTEPAPPEGETISVGSGETTSGTPGSDTISTPGYVDLPVNIDGGAGNDLILVTGTESEIVGGSGNDEIFVRGYANQVSGGPGDDVLNGGQNLASASDYFGDEGDDTINFDSTFAFSDEANTADGGPGADTLRVDVSPSDLAFAVPDFLTGGTGADTFAINIGPGFLPMTDEGAALPPDATLDTGLAVIITDFEPDEDVLVIDAENITDSGEVTLSSYSLIPSADGTYTDLRLTLDHSGVDNPVQATIRVFGTASLQDSDIRFLNLPLLNLNEAFAED